MPGEIVTYLNRKFSSMSTTDQNPSDEYPPIKKLLMALLGGLFSNPIDTSTTKTLYTTPIDHLDQIPRSELSQLADDNLPLYDAIRWLIAAPYLDVSSNVTIQCFKPEHLKPKEKIDPMELDSIELDAIRLPQIPLSRNHKASVIARYLKIPTDRVNIEAYLKFTAILSLESRLKQGYLLQSGNTKFDYYARFFAHFKEWLDNLLPETEIEIDDTCVVQRKLQLLIICFGLAFTHTSCENLDHLLLTKESIPDFCKLKTQVSSNPMAQNSTRKSSIFTEETRISGYDTGVRVWFPIEVLTKAPERNSAYTARREANRQSINSAITLLRYYGSDNSPKTPFIDSILSKLGEALDTPILGQQTRYLSDAIGKITTTDATLSKHRFYSPLIYLCIVVGLALGLVIGIVLWALADHKREFLRCIDRKPTELPHSCTLVRRTRSILENIPLDNTQAQPLAYA
jgi:hypothetical protein